jgi:DNA-binding NtrC family response regulator
MSTEQPRETLLVIDPVDISGQSTRKLLASPDNTRRLLHCTTAQEALSMVATTRPDLVLAGLDAPDLPGTRLLQALKNRLPGVPLIAIAPQATVEGAIQAIQSGATDYLGRPLSPGLLTDKIARALNELRTRRGLAAARDVAKDRYGFSQLLSRSPRMLAVFDQIQAVAKTDATVLIRGETGTGKELVARAIHERSRRKDRPLIGINCGAFTETLLESELFGHEKGSFTGAIGRRQGVFEMADGGSLFLDELGETSLSVQVNLLRVLEDLTFRRVGGTETIEVDVRIVAATNVNLEGAVKDGKFREDLFYRLNVFPILLPPLRERVEDIPLLMRHFLDDAAREYELKSPAISPDALDLILRYRWPGNVRQLRAMCERWVILCEDNELRRELLPAELQGGNISTETPGSFFVDDQIPLPELLERATTQLQRAYLHRMMTRTRGRIQEAAELSGTTRRTIYTLLKKLGIEADDYK